nr:tyrosine-type recombinase/integrase [Alicyclobacillus herbarius]
MLSVSPRWLTRKEQARFLHELEKEKSPRRRKRNVAIVQCMLQAGCRVAEVVTLDVDDVDLRRKTLTIRHGKRGKMRVVPMNRDLAGALSDWIEVRKQIDTQDSALFLSERNQRITVRALQHMVRSIFRRIGVENGSCQSFRHSFCKNLLDSGQPLNVVAQLAGHESVETTLRYLRPSEKDLYQAVENISSIR